MTAAQTPATAAGLEKLRPARPGGARRLTFDNGRYEDYQAVFVQHKSGEWDRILIARDDGSIARMLADLINGEHIEAEARALDRDALARAMRPYFGPSFWPGSTDVTILGGNPEDIAAIIADAYDRILLAREAPAASPEEGR